MLFQNGNWMESRFNENVWKFEWILCRCVVPFFTFIDFVRMQCYGAIKMRRNQVKVRSWMNIFGGGGSNGIQPETKHIGRLMKKNNNKTLWRVVGSEKERKKYRKQQRKTESWQLRFTFSCKRWTQHKKVNRAIPFRKHVVKWKPNTLSVPCVVNMSFVIRGAQIKLTYKKMFSWLWLFSFLLHAQKMWNNHDKWHTVQPDIHLHAVRSLDYYGHNQMT